MVIAIVNQSKSSIFIVDNALKISKVPAANSPRFKINLSGGGSNEEETLGVYSTLETANKVFQEIIEFIQSPKRYVDEIEENVQVFEDKLYQMPADE